MANNLEYTLRLKDLFSKTMQGAANQVKGLDGKMGSLKESLGGIKGAIASAFSVGAIVSFGKAVIDSLVNYEYFSSSLKTMMKGDAEQAKALEGQLISLAKTTPFSLVDVQQGTKQLLAYGFAAGEVVSTMKTLGDVSAGVGKPLTEVAYLYGTLKTQGRAFSKDINQFTTAGIPIIKELAKQFKVTDDKVMQLVTDGKVGFKEVEKAFQSMTSEGSIFFNLMDTQSQTVGGKISALGDIWEQIKVNIGKSQTGIIASTTDFITNFLNQINRTLSAENFLQESTKGKSRKNIFGQVNEQDVGFASILEEKLQNKTGNIKDVGETASFISGQLQYLQREKNKFNENVYQDFTGGKKGELTYFKGAEKKLSSDLAVSSNPLDFLMLLQDKRDLLLNAQKKLMGAARLLNSKGEATTESAAGDKTGKGGKSLGTGTEVTGQRPQAINININELVHELNIQTTNLTEGVGRMKELVSKALLETVNDINLIAMA